MKVKKFPRSVKPDWELDLSKFYWNLLELVGAFGKILTIVGFFPIMWQKIGHIQIVVVAVSWNLGKHIGQPFPGINITGFATSQQRIHDGSIFSRFMVATKQIPFSSNSQGPNGIFGQVIQTF
jgi:hypothetical protein